MKLRKLPILLLAGVLALSLCACGGEDAASSPSQSEAPSQSTEPSQDVQESTEPETPPEPEETPGPTAVPVSVGGSIDNDNFLMTFDSMELLDEYRYSTGEHSYTSLYVEDGYKLLAVRGHFENRATGPISDSAFHFSVLVNGTYAVDGYDVSLHFQRDKYFEIDAYTDQDYVLSINVPNKLAEQFETAEFTIGFNDDLSAPETVFDADGSESVKVDNLYTLSATAPAGGEAGPAGTPEVESAQLVLGETYSTSECEITFNEPYFTKKCSVKTGPSSTTSTSASEGNVLLVLDSSIKNIATEALDNWDTEFYTAYALYDGKYKYEGDFFVGDHDIAPLSTKTQCLTIEMPAELENAAESIVLFVTIGGQEYQYVVRGEGGAA